MLYTTKGTILSVGSVQEFNGGFRKKPFAIKVEGQTFGGDWGFSLIKDDVDTLSPNDVGKEVEVNFEIRGREYQGKYYIDLESRSFSFVTKTKVTRGEKVDASTIKQPPIPAEITNAVGDDLPF